MMFLLLIFIGFQCVLAQQNESHVEEIKWPDINAGNKNHSVELLDVKSFNTYISTYHDDRNRSSYDGYRMDKMRNTRIFRHFEPAEGFPMKLWQTFIGKKQYLVWIQKDKFTIFSAQNFFVNLTFNVGSIKNESQAFVLGQYIVAGEDSVYDLGKALKREPLIVKENLDDVVLNGKKLPDDVKNVIVNSCFNENVFCAQYLPGSKNSLDTIVDFKDYEIVMAFDKEVNMYVMHGNQIGLEKNQRYFYYLWDGNNNVEYFIPQNLTINDDETPLGVRTMLFPYVHTDDAFVEPFVPQKTTTHRPGRTTTKGPDEPTVDPNEKYYPEYEDGKGPDNNSGFSSIHQMTLFVCIYWLFD